VGEVIAIPFNDLDQARLALERHRAEVAAVIVEPVMVAAGIIPAEPEFLHGLRQVTGDIGALLICDEVATLRLDWGGAQQRYGITPDLTCFGKIIGGGLPAGAFGGRADVMAVYDPTGPGTIAHSGTYNGNALAMAAGIATLDLYPPPVVQQLNQAGDELRGRLQAACDRAGLPASLTGLGSLIGFHPVRGPVRNAHQSAGADRRIIRALHLELLLRGIFSASRQMYVLSTAMLDDTAEPIARFESVFEEAVGMIADAARGEGTVS